MNSSPLISAIVVNFNGRRFIGKCLESILNQSYGVHEVIVVDNASDDGSVEHLKEHFPGIKVIRLRENIGFAGANIEGLKHADGEYIMLLNNDAEAGKDCLAGLAAAMKSNPAVGICASKVLVHGQEVIDSAGDGFATNLRGFERGRGRPSNSYNEEEEVFGASAGAALYRRAMIEEIGFLDSDFFLIHGRLHKNGES